MTFAAAYVSTWHSCEAPCFLGQFRIVVVPGSGAGWRGRVAWESGRKVK